MNEVLVRLYATRIAELEQQVVKEQARAEAAEAALAFERGQREHATARLIEMGRQAIQCKEEANHLRLTHATLESNMRFQLGDRIAKDTDQAYLNRTRELEEWFRRLNGRGPSKQEEQDLKDLLLCSMEEFRMIVRRAL